MTNYDVDFSYWTKQFGTIDKLPADNIDDVDAKAFDYFNKYFIGDDDKDDFSEFMVESIMESRV